MVRVRKENTLSEAISSKGYGEQESKSFVASFAKDLTNEQLEIAIDVAATSQSIDDFKREFQHASTDALINSFDATGENISSILKNANDQGYFNTGDLKSLEHDDNFTAWMEEQSFSMTELLYSNYTEQYNILSKFYSDLQGMSQESLNQNIKNYKEDLAEYQAIMDYKLAVEEGLENPYEEAASAATTAM